MNPLFKAPLVEAELTVLNSALRSLLLQEYRLEGQDLEITAARYFLDDEAELERLARDRVQSECLLRTEQQWIRFKSRFEEAKMRPTDARRTHPSARLTNIQVLEHGFESHQEFTDYNRDSAVIESNYSDPLLLQKILNMSKVPTIHDLYGELIDKHELVLLKNGADFQLNGNGDLPVDRRGVLQLGDKYFNALFQFVYRWIDHIEYIKTALPLGNTVSAGPVLVSLNSLLKESLMRDLGFDPYDLPTIWYDTAPQFNGISLGRAIEVGANNARHYEEWTTTWVRDKQFDRNQKKSVDAIIRILQFPEQRLAAGNVCPQLLATLCKNDFETLEKAVFLFARDLTDSSRVSGV